MPSLNKKPAAARAIRTHVRGLGAGCGTNEMKRSDARSRLRATLGRLRQPRRTVLSLSLIFDDFLFANRTNLGGTKPSAALNTDTIIA